MKGLMSYFFSMINCHSTKKVQISKTKSNMKVGEVCRNAAAVTAFADSEDSTLWRGATDMACNKFACKAPGMTSLANFTGAPAVRAWSMLSASAALEVRHP